MPVHELCPHPQHPPLAVAGVSVSVWGGRRDLMLAYEVRGIEKLKMPAVVTPERRDGLWSNTCFELFLRVDGNGGYVEYNFSPSTCWAAYVFDGYRAGMRSIDPGFVPIIEPWVHGLEANCDPGELPRGDLAMGLSAVIEETDGTKSYWALAHPSGPPDFHHPACFAATLPPPPPA